GRHASRNRPAAHRARTRGTRSHIRSHARRRCRRCTSWRRGTPTAAPRPARARGNRCPHVYIPKGTTHMNQAFLDQLTQALGTDAVITDPAELEPWLTDWRGVYKGGAQAVVRPTTTEQVAACLRLCNEHRVPVVPRGGNTGLCGGATPD